MIYLDYAATTPCSPEVVSAMLPYFSEQFGNAASIDHGYGVTARKAVDRAREQVAALVGARPEQVIFTSGSTEANNMVLNNEMELVYGSLEHPSIREPAATKNSRAHHSISSSQEGLYSLEDLAQALARSKPPALVSLMWVNNETGATQDLIAAGKLAGDHGAFFHTDASQGLYYDKLDVSHVRANAISVSAHKLYGPKGIGALICDGKLRTRLRPLSHGGGHERGLRSGTLNVPAIVGFGEAARLAKCGLSERRAQMVRLKEAFISTMRSDFPSLSVNSEDTAAPHICSLTLHGVNNRALLQEVADQVCFSLGSACSTGRNEPSHVLISMGLTKTLANSTIRCSFSHLQSIDEVSTAAKILTKAAARLASAYVVR